MTPFSLMTGKVIILDLSMGNQRNSDSGRAIPYRTTADALVVSALVVIILSAATVNASACGWWGDGENDETESITIGADGHPVSEDIEKSGIPYGLQVPAPRSGYGMVVLQGGTAMPYLHVVKDNSIHSIQQLRQFGFPAVIDLGTPPAVATLHQLETGPLGMKYFNIPLDQGVPGEADVLRFSEIISTWENLPILVFSASANQLGRLWANYQLLEGFSRKDAVRQGRQLGLTEDDIRNLRK